MAFNFFRKKTDDDKRVSYPKATTQGAIQKGRIQAARTEERERQQLQTAKFRESERGRIARSRIKQSGGGGIFSSGGGLSSFLSGPTKPQVSSVVRVRKVSIKGKKKGKKKRRIIRRRSVSVVKTPSFNDRLREML